MWWLCTVVSEEYSLSIFVVNEHKETVCIFDTSVEPAHQTSRCIYFIKRNMHFRSWNIDCSDLFFVITYQICGDRDQRLMEFGCQSVVIYYGCFLSKKNTNLNYQSDWSNIVANGGFTTTTTSLRRIIPGSRM
jgi:hypothetical protein